jgi:hypothetical protein
MLLDLMHALASKWLVSNAASISISFRTSLESRQRSHLTSFIALAADRQQPNPMPVVCQPACIEHSST